MTNKTGLFQHKSVLVDEVLKYLDPQPNGVYIDATFGGGGHTSAILDYQKNCRVIGIDWDQDALDHGNLLLETYGERLELWQGNFAKISMLCKKFKIDKVDGILADFGTSQHQIFTAEGFSFNRDSFLDMRMSQGHYQINAADVVNRFSEADLAQILFELGDEFSAKKIAKLIVEERKKKRIRTTGELADLIIKVKGPKRGRIHPATKVFQALRIYVNHELDNIHSFLQASVKILKNHGRLVCISFHSLEDRLVKQFFQDQSKLQMQAKFEILTPKVVVASAEELKRNPSARSARLRAAELLE